MVDAVDGAEAASGSRNLASSGMADAPTTNNGGLGIEFAGSSKIWVEEGRASSKWSSMLGSSVD